MSLLRITENGQINGPHQQNPIQKGGATPGEADAAMIMIHGRGASASSIADLSRAFDTGRQLRLAAPQAAGHTWYPYSFLAPAEKNEPGLSSGLQQIYTCISELREEGFKPEQIYLLGFSQGACLATEFAARHPQQYGGLIILSGGLIGDEVNPELYTGSLEQTPVFMGCSDVDPHIPLERFNETETVLNKLGANITKKVYPGMGHLVNEDEIEHISTMLNTAK